MKLTTLALAANQRVNWSARQAVPFVFGDDLHMALLDHRSLCSRRVLLQTQLLPSTHGSLPSVG